MNKKIPTNDLNDGNILYLDFCDIAIVPVEVR